MDEEKTTQEQEAEGAAAAEAGAEPAETVAEAEKTKTGTVTDDAGDPEPAERTAGDEADHTQDGGEGAPGLRGQGGASVVARGVCADGSADDHGQHGKGCAGCAVR